ncbi:MAG: hypothetical protein HWE14_01950 [Flavobacteriia bacterium]|nr:hypothetical protein [Flavobacteriia bacterium]
MNNNRAVFSLFGGVFLQKAYYYGVKGLVVLIMVETLSYDAEEALDSYGLISRTHWMIALPLGFLIDFVLGSKRAMSLGLLAQVLSGALLSMGIYPELALALLAAGSTSFLIGIHKEVSNCGLTIKMAAFFSVFLSFVINMGGSFGIVSVGFLGDVMGYGSAVQTALVLLIFAFPLTLWLKRRKSSDSLSATNTNILDQPLLGENRTDDRPASWRTFILFIVLGTFYWSYVEYSGDHFGASFSTLGISSAQSANVLVVIVGSILLLAFNIQRKKLLWFSGVSIASVICLGLVLHAFDYSMSLAEYWVWSGMSGLAEVAIFYGVYSSLWTEVPKKWVGTAIGAYMALSILVAFIIRTA